MAVLKDLIVHGASRFLDKSFFTDIESDSISVTKLMAKGLTANDATVVGLLDVQGELHTKSFSNSNIATIDGSFYITPTIGSDSGTVTIDATNRTMSFSGGNYAISSLYIDNENSPTWTSGSLVIITGSVKVNGEWIPLGTQKGVLGTVSSSSIAVNSLTDNKAIATTSTVISLIGSQTSIPYKDLKISIYQWKKNSSTSLAPVGIYMTALSSAGRTFIDVYGGGNAVYGASDSYKGLAKPVVRIGNLTNCGLDAVGGIAPSGWGIYTQNGFFSGTVAAERGKIGTGTKVWTIGNDGDNRSYIYSGPTSVSGTTPGTYVGTDGFLNYASNTAYVKMTGGVITAVGAVIKGTLTAGANSSIGPWTVTTTSIYKGNATHGTSGSGNMYFGNSGLSISNTFLVDNAGNLSATGAVFKNVILKDGSNNTRASIDGNGLIVYDGVGADTSNIVSQFTSTGVTIGKTGATHVDIKSNSLEITDRIGGITFFKVRDAVNEYGQVVDTFSGDGKTTEFTLNYTAANTSYTVTQNDTTVSPNKTTTKITFSTAPAVGDQIVITYNVTDNSAKGYDFGIRKSNTITGIYSVIEGYNTTASGKYSHAEGFNTTASGRYSHAEGYWAAASESFSHAEGYWGAASGRASHAEGGSTKASGGYSHAEGGSTIASGKYSHAEGSNTKASGGYSHAEGCSTIASGPDSHAEGDSTIASGSDSHAGGWETKANGHQSFAHGYQVQADFNQEFVIGRFNNTSLTPYINTIYVCDENDYNKATLTFPNTYGNYQSDFYITYNGSFPPSPQCVNVTSSTITIIAAPLSSTGNGHFEDGDEIGIILDSNFPQFVIGNGDTTHKSNALSIRRNGDVHANGNIYVNCDDDSSGTAHIGQVFNWQGNLKSNLTANAGAYVEGNGSITLKGGHTYLVLAYVAITNSTNGSVERRAQIFNKTANSGVLTGNKFVASQVWGTVETQTIYEANQDVTLTVRGAASRPTTTIPTAWIRAVCIA